MKNIVLFPVTEEGRERTEKLGLDNTLFLEDVVIITGKTAKEVLKQAEQARRSRKIICYKPHTEELLRFALEKTPINVVYGIESIHPKDSTHYVRGGLDQVLCTIAREKGKVLAFSFAEILQAKYRGKMLARMMANIKLCEKYKVSYFMGNFSLTFEEMRSQKDLDAFLRVLGGKKKTISLLE